MFGFFWGFLCLLCLFVFEGCRVDGKECLHSQKVSFIRLEFLYFQLSNNFISQALHVVSSRWTFYKLFITAVLNCGNNTWFICSFFVFIESNIVSEMFENSRSIFHFVALDNWTRTLLARKDISVMFTQSSVNVFLNNPFASLRAVEFSEQFCLVY